MAGTRLTIDASALKPLEAHVRGLAAMDTSTLMPRLGEYLQRSVQERFKTETDPSGGPWQALAPRTLKAKRRNRDKVLTQRGYLRSRISWRLTAPTVVEVGSPLIYAASPSFISLPFNIGSSKNRRPHGALFQVAAGHGHVLTVARLDVP